jgi:hypothetical protein
MPESVFTHTIPLLLAGGACFWAVLAAGVEGEAGVGLLAGAAGVLRGAALAGGVPLAVVAAGLAVFSRGALAGATLLSGAVLEVAGVELAASPLLLFLERLLDGALVAVASADSAVLLFFDRLFFALEPSAAELLSEVFASLESAVLLFFERLFFVEASADVAVSARSALFFLVLDLLALPLLAVASELPGVASAASAFFLLFFFLLAVESD